MQPHAHDPVDFANFTARVANPTPLAQLKRGGRAGREFKEFALRGSVLDMAIGIILGVAFGKIISSFVEDLMMPLIGFVFGKVDFSNLFVSLSGKHFDTLVAAKGAGAPTLNYGLFLNAIFNFLIVAFGIFVLIRQVNRLKRAQVEAEDAAHKQCLSCFCRIPVQAIRCPFCTSEIAIEASTAAATT